MMRILCYGDSNTWGCTPGSGERFDERTRWPAVLAHELGSGHAVVEEGLNGRTTVHDDPTSEFRNGKAYLTPCLWSHHPVDLVVLMLGTNDLKEVFGLSAPEIARGMEVLGRLIRATGAGPSGRPPRLLLVCPPPLNPLGANGAYAGGVEKSRELATHYGAVAAALGCAFFDAASSVRSSPVDGIHWEAAEHRAFGRALAPAVSALLREAPEASPTSIGTAGE